MTALRRVYNTNRVMEDLFQSLWNSAPESNIAPLDVIEKQEEYVLIFDLPGVKKESVDVSIKDRVLTVSVNKEERKEEGRYLVKNRENITFKKSYTIPENSDSESLSASMELGILTLNLKKKEESLSRKVSIS